MESLQDNSATPSILSLHCHSKFLHQTYCFDITNTSIFLKKTKQSKVSFDLEIKSNRIGRKKIFAF
jgi:hypothetical protein